MCPAWPLRALVSTTATAAAAAALLSRLPIPATGAVDGVGVEKGTLDYVRSHPSMQTFLADGVLEVKERFARVILWMAVLLCVDADVLTASSS